MPQYWLLNGHFDPAKTQGLYEAIDRRESCRCFLSAPSTQQWESVKLSAEAFALPGVRIVLGLCENALFLPFGGLLMKFENVQRFAAVLTLDDNPESIVNAGISGEMLMLDAVQKGLGGCWVAGTYKHKEVGLSLAEGEKIRALIALGVPKENPSLPLQRKRKPLSSICSLNFEQAPPAFLEVARAVQKAPSAINLQPWRLAFTPENSLSIAVKRPAQRLDLGIAISHAVLAMGSTPVQYHLSEDGLSARLTL